MGRIITIPEDLFPATDCMPPAGRTAIRKYDSVVPSLKTRVTIHKNLFSFLLEGEKVVHLPGKPIRIRGGQFLLIAGGNCMMTEKLSTNGRYSSLLFFFDESVLASFWQKHAVLRGDADAREWVVPFQSDEFIGNFVHSLQVLPTDNLALREELQLLKLEELLLYLAVRYPDRLRALRQAGGLDAGDELIRATLEGNLHQPMPVEDLAFLCNMSLSTFKRRFARLYGTTPSKWLLQKRMERAAALLEGQEKPSEVFFKVGYENHSSFTQSFKQVYGVTPREYQQQRLDVYP